MFSRELSENEDIYLQKPNLKTEIAGYLIHIESDSPLLVVLTIHIIIAVRRILIKILSVVINGQRSHKIIVPGGCYLGINIIRKIDRKIKMRSYSFCDPNSIFHTPTYPLLLK